MDFLLRQHRGARGRAGGGGAAGLYDTAAWYRPVCSTSRIDRASAPTVPDPVTHADVHATQRTSPLSPDPLHSYVKLPPLGPTEAIRERLNVSESARTCMHACTHSADLPRMGGK